MVCDPEGTSHTQPSLTPGHQFSGVNRSFHLTLGCHRARVTMRQSGCHRTLGAGEGDSGGTADIDTTGSHKFELHTPADHNKSSERKGGCIKSHQKELTYSKSLLLSTAEICLIFTAPGPPTPTLCGLAGLGPFLRPCAYPALPSGKQPYPSHPHASAGVVTSSNIEPLSSVCPAAGPGPGEHRKVFIKKVKTGKKSQRVRKSTSE
ncbi:uncharacterized protein LOC123630714 isoform X2 [Lemur catta]|uniref:uncharacterized protein LOC123630714 isoform X2 n=1 Tax=Lemur catta TaxID=9447 RepID=UPI001E2689E7|nr:uncharacterized protein LOC123630714 isoform X2 [Lemur catta]XP_045396572.1 uncharacterized protein LOC123630714 isoform X2 [Lemur catta]XP_045396573.1 uncharacterized protein LOC123630714 isoform X2 [Lemur catta]